MNFHCVMLRKTSIAYFTNVGFFFGVNNIMSFKHIFVSKAFETDFTLVASCSLNKIVLKSRDGILGSLMFNHRKTMDMFSFDMLLQTTNLCKPSIA